MMLICNARVMGLAAAGTVVMGLSAGTADADPVSAVRDYGQGNPNDVDKSGTSLTYTQFYGNVAAAYDQGMGGVISFRDDESSYNEDSASPEWTISFGTSDEKVLSVGGLRQTANHGDREPISFDAHTIGIGDAATEEEGGVFYGEGYIRSDFIWDFRDITGGDEAERVTAVGGTILSREGDTIDNPRTAVVTFEDYFTGETRQEQVSFILDQDSGEPRDDTFVGFESSGTEFITRLAILDDDGRNGGFNWTASDDVGFTTSIVPEPGSLALLGAAGLGLLVRRNRR